ncbi:Na+-translocating ferredoxin:NAD+ oxidoreductase subunit C [Gammaproteobacteria bacterium]
MNISSAQIIQKVRSAGVIGAGGGGFPTYVKLQAKVDTIIANGSECEPLLSSDCSMMEQKPDWLIAGVQIAMQATGAKNAVIALKAHYHDAINAIKEVLPKDNSIKLHLLENYYPAGDEFLLVYEVTGKVIPEGGIPLNVGIIVNNVITLMQIYQAVNGKPVTERAITLAGEFNEPKIVTASIGTTYENLIKIAGGLKNVDAVLIDGGPMMGKIVDNWDLGIAKTTSGVLALPKDHFIVAMAQQSLSQMIKRSKAACCQCFRCSDLCPRNLIGHDIYPHMTMRTIDYNQAEPAKHITSTFLCSQCGVCELIACDFMLLSPRKILGAYRKELIKKGIKNPHARTKIIPNSQFENRKIAIPMLLKKLDLKKYDVELPCVTGVQPVKKVRISLNKHIGLPALSQVQMGQKVKMCDIIASTPDDILGTVYHASIDGKITDVNNEWIEITE